MAMMMMMMKIVAHHGHYHHGTLSWELLEADDGDMTTYYEFCSIT